MKKIFTAILLCVASAGWSATEYLRPSADATTTVGTDCFTNTAGTNTASSSMSAVYSGKSGAGPTGASASSTGSGSTVVQYVARVFNTWQSSSHSYSALTLNLSVNCVTTALDLVGGACGASYSTDGTTYTNAYYFTSNTGGSDAQHTITITITGATLSNVKVRTCARGYSDGSEGDSGTINVYDIWTAGTYSASTSHTHTWLLSYLDEQIWRWHDAKPEEFWGRAAPAQQSR
jgi:hypothetical protein